MEDDKVRTPMTILFSDIKGSTRYAEQRGDVEYMAMIDRHNRMLFPVIDVEGGQIVKTIGDSILARFDDPVAAIRAAAGMQQVLAKDRDRREEMDQIHIRIGMHFGMGLVKDSDVFGDVVNAASHVEHQAEAGQVLITDALVKAAKAAGFECAKMGRAELKGKDEAIDLYAVAWSDRATQQLIEDIQSQHDKKLKELKKQHAQIEEEFEGARDQWRTERRALSAEIEQLQDNLNQARERARQQTSHDLQSELLFRVAELSRLREQLEHDLASARQTFEAERNNLKAQMVTMQANVVDAMERANNPTRVAMAVRQQVESRMAEAQQSWQLQWEGERKRLHAEIERYKKAGSSIGEKKEASRRALLVKLGKLPPGAAGPIAKNADQWEREFQDAKFQWQAERDRLQIEIKKLESSLRQAQDSMNNAVVQEMRNQYERKLTDAHLERQRLEQEIQYMTSVLATERQRLSNQVKALEEALPEAQKAARTQAVAELQSQLDPKIEEANRIRSRIERNFQDAVEEWEHERRQAKKQIVALNELLKEARQAAFKASKEQPQTNI
jgi:class 3 adenylate cyclase